MSQSTFSAPPLRTPFPEASAPTTFCRGWIQWFQAITDKFNALFASPPVITGSRGGNVALTNLLKQLDAQGYVKDETTP